jgi:uncharacterized protein (DUF433 family)
MINPMKNIKINNTVMLGKPVIKGTRITVELILGKLSGGYSFEDILEMYPNLETKDILACVEYKRGSNAVHYD